MEQTHGGDRRGLRAVARGELAGARFHGGVECPDPVGLHAVVAERGLELLEHQARVAADAEIQTAVVAERRRVAVDLDHAGALREAAEEEVGVEARADRQHQVGLEHAESGRAAVALRVRIRKQAARGIAREHRSVFESTSIALAVSASARVTSPNAWPSVSYYSLSVFRSASAIPR